MKCPAGNHEFGSQPSTCESCAAREEAVRKLTERLTGERLDRHGKPAKDNGKKGDKGGKK